MKFYKGHLGTWFTCNFEAAIALLIRSNSFASTSTGSSMLIETKTILPLAILNLKLEKIFLSKTVKYLRFEYFKPILPFTKIEINKILQLCTQNFKLKWTTITEKVKYFCRVFFFLSCHPLIITPLWRGPYCIIVSSYLGLFIHLLHLRLRLIADNVSIVCSVGCRVA